MADIDFAELKNLKENGSLGRAFKVNIFNVDILCRIIP